MRKLTKFKNKLITLLAITIFLTFISLAYENKVFSLHFVDEEENLTVGRYLLRGEVLYKDVFAQHQPLSYILSAKVQELTSPNSVYLLIKKHREAVIIWSFFWAVILILRFGIKLLPFIVFFELTKFFLLGNVFLAEALVIYPLSYLAALVLMEVQKINKLEFLCTGFISSLLFLLLFPIWPVTLFLLGLILYSHKKNFLQTVLLILVGTIPLLIFSLMYLSIPSYMFITFDVNLNWYAKLTASEPYYVTVLKSFFNPIITFLPKKLNPTTLLVTRFFSVLLIFNLIYFLKQRLYKRALIIFVMLGLTNLRFYDSSLSYYEGFHALPWYALLLLTVLLTSIWVIQKTTYYPIKLFISVVIILCFTQVYNSAHDILLNRTDRDKDFFVNYSRQADVGEAIKIMRNKEDKMFMAPDEILVYWAADIKHASSMVFFYNWMVKAPFLNDPVHKMFQENPPTFFYISRYGTGFEPYLNSYIPVMKDGKDTGLFVLPSKAKDLSNDQIDKLDYRRYKVPNSATINPNESRI